MNKLTAKALSIAMAIVLCSVLTPAAALAATPSNSGSTTIETFVDGNVSGFSNACASAQAPSVAVLSGSATNAVTDATADALSPPDLQGMATQATLDAADVASYSYQVRPLLAPFNNLVYVETDNPDPYSFRITDEDSRYLDTDSTDAERAGFVLYPHLFMDVAYEDKDAYRVPGGYIFYDCYCNTDGGTLQVQAKNDSGAFESTGVTVQCSAMEDSIDYLIDTYASTASGFFDKLDAVAAALNSLAVYPKAIKDTSKPSADWPYPFLAASPYEELRLNEHYETMWETADEDLLAKSLHPYVLHSLGFPGTIGAAAKRLNPSCTVSSGIYHYVVEVTLNGETNLYGGAGNGGTEPILSKFVTTTFDFSGSAGDMATYATIDSLGTRYLDYASSSKADLAVYKDQIAGDVFRDTIYAAHQGRGSWIRILMEGWLGSSTQFAYEAYGPNGRPTAVSDAWVDGRYVNTHEIAEPSEGFSEHPTADIVLRNVSYTDRYGRAHVNEEVVYEYDKANDRWWAPYYYAQAWAYSLGWTIPSELILTRAQVEAMSLDYACKSLPEEGLIYDGTALGAPFRHILVTGVSLPDSMTVEVGVRTVLEATVTPADATWADSLNYTLSDEDSANRIGFIYHDRDNNRYIFVPEREGTATLTVTTEDGRFTDTTQITVVAHTHQPGAPVREEMRAATCWYEGYYYETVTCTTCNEQLSRETKFTERLPHTYVDGVCTGCGAKDPNYTPDPTPTPDPT
ncbi:MAG: hypothetical protein Q4E12_07335, partial [Coriobacteriia bacterium]|nr:hypothetical protein [Coriobacteriia bacterium]